MYIVIRRRQSRGKDEPVYMNDLVVSKEELKTSALGTIVSTNNSKVNQSQLTPPVQGTPPIRMLENVEIKKKLGSGFVYFEFFLNFQGNFGEVYVGSWNGTKVALKKLKNKDALEEFMKEAGTLSQVIHPNCVQFLGIYRGNE